MRGASEVVEKPDVQGLWIGLYLGAHASCEPLAAVDHRGHIRGVRAQFRQRLHVRRQRRRARPGRRKWWSERTRRGAAAAERVLLDVLQREPWGLGAGVPSDHGSQFRHRALADEVSEPSAERSDSSRLASARRQCRASLRGGLADIPVPRALPRARAVGVARRGSVRLARTPQRRGDRHGRAGRDHGVRVRHGESAALCGRVAAQGGREVRVSGALRGVVVPRSVFQGECRTVDLDDSPHRRGLAFQVRERSYGEAAASEGSGRPVVAFDRVAVCGVLRDVAPDLGQPGPGVSSGV